MNFYHILSLKFIFGKYGRKLFKKTWEKATLNFVSTKTNNKERNGKPRDEKVFFKKETT